MVLWLCMYLPMDSLQRRVSANASMLLCSPPQCQPLVVWHGWSWWSCVLVKWQGSCPWMGEINPPKDPEIQQIQHAIAPPSTNIAVPPPFLASVQKIEDFRTTNTQGSPRGTNRWCISSARDQIRLCQKSKTHKNPKLLWNSRSTQN